MDAQGAGQLPVAAMRLLVELSDAPSIGAAARRLGIAQSNASRSLRALEDRLGVRILDRSARGTRLTEQGRLLAHWAAEVVDALDRFDAAVQSLTSRGGRELRVGASQTIAEHLAPGWLAAFHRAVPAASVALQMTNSEGVLDALAHRQLDLGFVECPEVPARYQRQVVAEDELTLVAHPTHPWARAASNGQLVLPSEVARTPLLLRESGSGTRAVAERALAAFGGPTTLMEFSSTAAIVRAVEAGTGPALLSALSVADAVARGRVAAVPVLGNPFQRSLHAVWLGGAQLTGAHAQLLRIATGEGRSVRPA